MLVRRVGLVVDLLNVPLEADPPELTLDTLQKINQLVQSQLAKQARKADTKKSSDSGKKKAYVAGNHALGAVPIQPSLRPAQRPSTTSSSGGKSEDTGFDSWAG